MKRILCFLFALLLLLSGQTAMASGSWLTFTEKNVPENLGFLVQEYTGTVTVTFLGDCTLGGEEKTRSSSRGFFRMVEKNGYDYPFRNLIALTSTDDLTVANLEGVLSDRNLEKVRKEFNFIGSAAYTEILTKGSVDCVSLANNHTHDYDRDGFEDTRKALEAAGVAYFSTDHMAVWRNADGLMIGFLGVSGSLGGSRSKAYQRKAALLHSLGCSAVITVMHSGTEYDSQPNSYQREIVRQAASGGSCLVIGHHPHVVQGFEIAHGIPVVYSLGNCSFGGNSAPRDYDALAVRADLRFTEGELEEITLHFYPVSISGTAGRNDYSPVFLTGEDADRVLKKMEQSTGVSVGPFRESGGAEVTVPIR